MLTDVFRIDVHILTMCVYFTAGSRVREAERKANEMMELTQVAQLSQRDRAAGWVSFGQKLKIGTGRRYFAEIKGLSLPL